LPEEVASFQQELEIVRRVVAHRRLSVVELFVS